MGKREGHVFHPAEGARSRALLGHGPVFTDMNLRLDPHAASAVLRARLPLRLFPYELARQVSLRPEGIARQGTLAAWLSGRSRQWTDYWRDVIGRDGFYPFDALAAAHVLAPAAFTCAPMQARVAPDTQVGLFGGGPMSLLVGPDREATRQVSYCMRVRTADFDALWSRVR